MGNTNKTEYLLGRYKVGDRISGPVVSMKTYGAFVRLEPSILGMVHVSDISWTKRYKRAADALAVGDQVEAIVLEVRPMDGRISLGMKQATKNPWDVIAAKYKVGEVISGSVTNLVSFGAFVSIAPGVDALLHTSEIPAGVKLAPGQAVEVRIRNIDRVNQRIQLSLKPATRKSKLLGWLIGLQRRNSRRM